MLNSLVKPRGALSERALRVHGIEAHQLDAAPLWTALWRDEGARLLRELGARPIGAYNAPFDRRLLAQTSQDASFALADSSRWFCVMNVSAAPLASDRRSVDGRSCFDESSATCQIIRWPTRCKPPT